MRIFSFTLASLGILAALYAFIGTLFAARNQLPIDCLPMKIYRGAYRGGVLAAIVGIFLFVFF